MKLPTYQQLSKEQDRVYNLPLDESFLVTGPPGTGKTVMALYRARALGDAGADVVLLMYFRLLHQYVDSAIEALGIEGVTTTFHSWFGTWWWKAYQEYYPQLEKWRPDWLEIVWKLQTDPPNGTTAGRPHLVIDEAQDMDANFFLMTALLAKAVTVFADENQRITTTNATLEEIRTNANIDREVQLKRNYRNTYEIAQLARRFYTGATTGIAEDPDRHGEPPVLRRFSSLSDEIEHIARFVKTHGDLEVGVFVPTIGLRKKFFNRLKARLSAPGQVQQYIGGQGRKAVPLDWDQAGVKVVSYASAKGLEFDAVFVPHLQMVTWDLKVPDIRMQFYVLATRARDHLFFSFTGVDDPEILGIFPGDDFLEHDL